MISKERPLSELLKFSIINIDKPTGPTSFDISNFVRKTLAVNKTSHFGTLDPMVTGVLPVALGRACRLSDYFMHHDKEYVGIMRLHETVDEKELQAQMKKFLGKIMQLPPVRSRVKRALREREVKSFEILEREGNDVLFRADVQAGTYIRKLIHDLGETLGGAHMLELRRTRAAIFTEEKIHTLYEFEKVVEEFRQGNETSLRAMLIPADEAITEVLPVMQLTAANKKNFLTGKPLQKEDLQGPLPEEEVFAGFIKKEFIGIYKQVQEGDIVARPEFVFN